MVNIILSTANLSNSLKCYFSARSSLTLRLLLQSWPRDCKRWVIHSVNTASTSPLGQTIQTSRLKRRPSAQQLVCTVQFQVKWWHSSFFFLFKVTLIKIMTEISIKDWCTLTTAWHLLFLAKQNNSLSCEVKCRWRLASSSDVTCSDPTFRAAFQLVGPPALLCRVASISIRF